MTATELLHTQSSAGENNNSNSGNKENTEIIKRWKVYNTPFNIIQTEQGWFTVMGDYRLTEVFEEEDELLKYTGISSREYFQEQPFEYIEDPENYATYKYYKEAEYAFLTSVISAIIDLTLKLKGGN